MSVKVTPLHQGHTSLEIITSHDSGLVLYFGLLRDNPDNIREDFLLLELRDGYPVLRVNQGSGEARLAVDGRDRQGLLRVGKLNDGEWHRLDIIIREQVYCDNNNHDHQIFILTQVIMSLAPGPLRSGSDIIIGQYSENISGRESFLVDAGSRQR